MHDEESGTWPAYVAAVAGLVQSLLLVTAVMAIAIYQAAKLGTPGAQADITPAALAAAEPVAYRPQAMIRLTFHEGSWRLDPQSEQRVRQALSGQEARGAEPWLISLRAHISDPVMRRAAYFRVMIVRNLLLDAGIDATRITLHLEDAPDDEGGTQTVQVFAHHLA